MVVVILKICGKYKNCSGKKHWKKQSKENVKQKKTRFNLICKEAIKRRKIARSKQLEDTENLKSFSRYRTNQKETSYILKGERGKYRKYIQNIANEMEQDYVRHNSRTYTVKLMCRTKSTSKPITL